MMAIPIVDSPRSPTAVALWPAKPQTPVSAGNSASSAPLTPKTPVLPPLPSPRTAGAFVALVAPATPELPAPVPYTPYPSPVLSPWTPLEFDCPTTPAPPVDCPTTPLPEVDSPFPPTAVASWAAYPYTPVSPGVAGGSTPQSARLKPKTPVLLDSE